MVYYSQCFSKSGHTRTRCICIVLSAISKRWSCSEQPTSTCVAVSVQVFTTSRPWPPKFRGSLNAIRSHYTRYCIHCKLLSEAYRGLNHLESLITRVLKNQVGSASPKPLHVSWLLCQAWKNEDTSGSEVARDWRCTYTHTYIYVYKYIYTYIKICYEYLRNRT